MIQEKIEDESKENQGRGGRKEGTNEREH